MLAFAAKNNLKIQATAEVAAADFAKACETYTSVLIYIPKPTHQLHIF